MPHPLKRAPRSRIGVELHDCEMLHVALSLDEAVLRWLLLVSPATVTIGIAVVRAVGWVPTQDGVPSHAAAVEACSTLGSGWNTTGAPRI